MTSVADSLSSSGSGFSRDNDPELVRDSLPVIIKIMEQLHDAIPKHRDLGVTLTRTTTSYAVGFIADDADRKEDKDVKASQLLRRRAKKLLLRAREVGLTTLDQHVDGLAAALRSGDRDRRDAALARTRKEAVPALYWTGAAWAAAIANAKDDIALIGDLPVVAAIMQRALALDEGFDEGALHEFFVSYDASQGAGKEAARRHFDRAVELSHGHRLSVLVNFAEAVDVDTQNKADFVRLLDQVQAFDVDSDPDHRLVNILAQRRAEWLKSRVADLFAE